MERRLSRRGFLRAGKYVVGGLAVAAGFGVDGDSAASNKLPATQKTASRMSMRIGGFFMITSAQSA